MVSQNRMELAVIAANQKGESKRRATSYAVASTALLYVEKAVVERCIIESSSIAPSSLKMEPSYWPKALSLIPRTGHPRKLWCVRVDTSPGLDSRIAWPVRQAKNAGWRSSEASLSLLVGSQRPNMPE